MQNRPSVPSPAPFALRAVPKPKQFLFPPTWQLPHTVGKTTTSFGYSFLGTRIPSSWGQRTQEQARSGHSFFLILVFPRATSFFRTVTALSLSFICKMKGDYFTKSKQTKESS